MVSVIAPLYHPVYEWVEKIFQLIPKLFEAFNMNEYFIGFEIGEPHHLPIDFVELHLCQSTIPAKQRRGNFQNFLLRVMRCSILVTFQSVVSLHTSCYYYLMCVVGLSLRYIFVWGLVLAMKPPWKSLLPPFQHECWTLLYRFSVSVMIQIS